MQITTLFFKYFVTIVMPLTLSELKNNLKQELVNMWKILRVMSLDIRLLLSIC